ncbi:MAG: hypothetical protein JXB34_09180 [Bacteroidales bacterium]|nr:hypothetical protein [Bacteroidales bacterium]
MRLLLVFSMLALAVSCSDSDKGFDMEPVYPVLNAGQIGEKLLSAYEAGSETRLQEILDYWSNEVHPNSVADINRSNNYDVYQVFELLYNPFSYSIIGNSYLDAVNRKLEYIVIQNTVYFDYNYYFDSENTKDSITGFCPPVSIANVKPLYHTPSYREAIGNFLGTGTYISGKNELDAETVLSEEQLNRLAFLNKKLAIFPASKGNGWYIETHPYISTIHFDNNKEKAFVIVRIGDTNGEALLEKENGNWKVISLQSGINW